MKTVLFGRIIPTKKIISISGKPASRSKAEKVILLLCSNAPENFLFKPLVLYGSQNPRVLKNENKGSLAVFWGANKKAWVKSNFL